MAAALWFLAVIWFSFDQASPLGGSEVGFQLVVVTAFVVFFLGLFAFTSSYAADDSRWPGSQLSFREFLEHEIEIGDSKMSGRDVLIAVAVMPIVLAVGGTIIGLVWVMTG